MIRSAKYALLLLSALGSSAHAAVVFGSAHAGSDGGSLLWQDRFPAGEDPIARIAVEDDRTFVAGKGPDLTANTGHVGTISTGWLVRAYDSATGAVLWRDAVMGFSAIENKANTIVATEGLVFVGGFTNPTSAADSALIRVYDARSGALRWQDLFDSGGIFAEVNGIAVRRDGSGRLLAFAVGRGTRSNGNNQWIVRAYDAKSGALLWQDVLSSGVFNDPESVTTDGQHVFAGGFTTDNTMNSRHFTVRAYDALSGTLLWQDRVASGMQGFAGGDAAVQVATEGSQLVAAGVITDTNGFHFAVRTYDTVTGTLLWADLVNTGAGNDNAESVTLHDGQAFIAGSGGMACSAGLPSDCDWLLRAYDQATGALTWSMQVDGNHQQDDAANVILACGDRIAIAGNAGTDSAAPYADWRVQVRSADTGALVWDDVLSTPATYAFPVGLAVSGTRLFAAGSTIDVAGGTQDGGYVVRAHDFGSGGTGCGAAANNSSAR
jgi:outer membrane protein assembly factor BamB